MNHSILDDTYSFVLTTHEDIETGKTPMLVVLLSANLISSAYLYRATDTGCFDLYEKDAVLHCIEPDNLPYKRWMEERSEAVKSIVTRITSLL